MTGYEESWDYFLSHITQQEEIDELEKQELLRNWSYLREVLGEDWFKKDEIRRHPLRSYFYNSAPWNLRWIAELGSGIKTLKQKENFNNILERLLSEEEFQSAYYEFRVGYSLIKAGISFDFIKPIKKKKKPDIVIHSENRDIFLEVTKKEVPEDYVKAAQNENKINGFLFSKTDAIGYYVDILKPLSTPRTDEILKKCEELIIKAKESGFEELHIPKIIDVYIFKKENLNKVPKEKRVTRSTMPDFDELFRIKGTIKEKAPQLNFENPGLLLIFDSNFWPENMEVFYSKLIDTLEETVYEFTNLSAAIINIETYLLDDTQFIKEDDNHIIIDNNLSRLGSKVIILNKYAKYPLSRKEIAILKKI